MEASKTHLDHDYLENIKVTDLFELQCQKQLSVTFSTEYVLICCLRTSWKTDYQCFDNKVASSFNKIGRVRQKIFTTVSCIHSCESSHFFFFCTMLRTLDLDDYTN